MPERVGLRVADWEAEVQLKLQDGEREIVCVGAEGVGAEGVAEEPETEQQDPLGLDVGVYVPGVSVAVTLMVSLRVVV